LTLIWVVLALLLIGVLAAATAVYLADHLTHSKRRRVEGTPGDLGLRYDDVQFEAADGVSLRGWYLESPGARAAIVLVHDVEGTRAAGGLLHLQRDYVRRGFHVLSFDLRGRGESSGGRDMLGDHELQDLQAAVAFARQRTGGMPLILHGFGMGATLAMVTAPESTLVSGVIADSAWLSSHEVLRHRWRHMPQPVFATACRLAQRLFGADVQRLSARRAVMSGITQPVLYIHGEDDRRVPVSHTLNLAAISLNPRDTVWTVPGVGHCASYVQQPEVYLRRCLVFIDSVVPVRLPVAPALPAARRGERVASAG